MSSSTVTSGAETEAVAAEPTPPQRVLPTAVVALLVAVLCALAAALALWSLHRMLEPPAAVDALLVALAVVALLPLVPAVRAFGDDRRRARHLAAGRLAPARHQAASGREHAHTAMGYALAVLICAGLVWFTTANDGAITTTFLRWEFLRSSFANVLDAFWINVEVAVGAQLLVLVVGLVVAVMRLLPGRAGRPLRWLAIAYVDTFRAIPSIITLYLVGFGLKLAQVPVFKDLSPVWLAIIALTLTYSSYVAEVYRAGIESIHPSQWAAARSLGLSYGMTLRTVIVPQAVRRIVPPLLNDFIGLQKDTALIGVMGVTDAFAQSRLTASNVFNLTPVIVVAVLFVLITIPQARYVDRLLAKEQTRTGRS
ncbi:amino acid ABC transporter permease [Geodermatophilus tzadiensis]|uniref:amino acid ABC transporter permease n=1 Tax=Geodermatophilus tzadiensis TaxID=1137988 RepID=UPI001B803DFE|nr:amino acid ABC transporter permease [Geodermatophilus tzadiensis]